MIRQTKDSETLPANLFFFRRSVKPLLQSSSSWAIKLTRYMGLTCHVIGPAFAPVPLKLHQNSGWDTKLPNAIFKLSTKATIFISILVAGLLVFVYLHWVGQRQTELIVFLVLTALAATLYTIRGDVSLEPGMRDLTARRLWLGWPVRHVVIRVGSDGELFLKEDVTHSQKGSGIHVAYDLEASGTVVSHEITEPGPYLVISEGSDRNKAALEAFANQAAEILGVPLHDQRRFK